jgi:hypothetical protein
MPRQRKTDRGPRATVVSAAPFTPGAVYTLLHDEVVKGKRVKAPILSDIVPLTHVLNVLQYKVRIAPWEPQGPVAKFKPWSSWPATRIVPDPQLGGHIESGGLGPMLGRAPTGDGLMERMLGVVNAELSAVLLAGECIR